MTNWFRRDVTEIDSEVLLNQFNKLMNELLRGNVTRNTFQPWEIEILLDIEGCQMRDSAKRETLKRYQKAVQRDMEKGAARPMMISAYLANQRSRRASVPEAVPVAIAEPVPVA